MNYKIIVEKPKRKFGVYVWINEEDKMLYVGESCDMNRRMCEHIRSIYNIENSSNQNLVNATKMQGKTFVGMAVYYAGNFNKNSIDIDKELLIDETIYMYAFVQKGYKLYNGKTKIIDENGNLSFYPNELNDNEGKARDFLRGNKDDMKECLHRYCSNKYGCNYDKEKVEQKIDMAFHNIEELFKKIEEIEPEISKNNKDNRYFALKEEDGNSKVNEVCNKIARVFLNEEEAKSIGLTPVSIDNLLDSVKNGDLKKIVVCGFGDYFDQSAMTILRTKQYDIMHNTLYVDGDDITINKREREEKGICFWAYGRSETDCYRNYLSEVDGRIDKSPRYLILPYVQSNLYASSKNDKENDFNLREDEVLEDFFKRMRGYYDEQYCGVRREIDEYNKNIDASKKDFQEKWNLDRKLINYRFENDNFAFGYAWNRQNINNKSGVKKKYPDTMFPEIIQKVTYNEKTNILRNRNSVAFLISELGYIDASIEACDLYEFFCSNTNNELKETMKGMNNVSCAELSDKEGLVDFLKSCSVNGGEIKVFIAKIEYPYVVALMNDPF